MPSVTKVKELVATATKLYDEIESILVNGSAEEKAKIPEMMADAEKAKGDALVIKNIEAARNELNLAASSVGGTTQRGSDFKHFGEFLTAVQMMTHDKIPDDRLVKWRDTAEVNAAQRPGASKDMSGTTGSAGGFLIPVEQLNELMAIQAVNNFVRQRATILPMTRRQILIPLLDQTDTTSGIPHWFGGLRAYWMEEAALKTPSDATFRQLQLTAWKLIMFTRTSDELLEDSAVSLAAFLSGNLGFAGAINWTEEYAFMQGTGVGQPVGVVSADCTLTQTRGTASHVNYPDLTGMLRKALPTQNLVWVISQSAMADLLEMSGPSGNPSYIWGSAVNGAPDRLLGKPVIWTDKSPILGSRGDVMLCDWSYYLIGDRKATTVESTKFEKWEYDQTSWRAVHRVDGKPWMSSAVTYADGTTAVSPFVALL